MVIDVTNITMPMAALLASMIGATATITAAFLQLRIAWRREMMERESRKPITKKTKRGPVTPVIVLLIASAIAGFALSQYMVSDSRNKEDALELELRTRIDQLSISAQKLDEVRLHGQDDVYRQFRTAELERIGKEGVAAVMGAGKCLLASAGTEAVAKPCNESQAMQMQLCTELPANVTVTTVELFARTDDEPGPWHERRVIAGRDFGGGRFSDKPVERAINEQSKQVCQGVSYWNSDFGMQGRMVVHYVLTPQTPQPVVTAENIVPVATVPVMDVPAVDKAVTDVPVKAAIP